MNSALLALIVVGGGTLSAIAGLLFVRKRYDVRQFKSHHEVGGYMLSVLGTLYAVVLGFVVVNVSEDFHRARENAGMEVNSMMDIYRLADGIPEKNRQEIAQACLEYTRAVVDIEWQDMPKGIFCVPATMAGEKIWHAIRNYAPQTPQEQCFYSAMIENYTTFINCRRIRLITALGSVSPVMWVVLIVGAIATIGFTYVFTVERLGSQIFMTALVALALTLNLYLVMVNSSPFTGDFKIRPIPFRLSEKVLETHGRVLSDPNFLLNAR